MKIIEKDILTVEKGIICQQVNCQGVMGSGLAKSIRDKWPVVYDEYITFCKQFSHKWLLLGHAPEIQINTNLSVINVFGQFNFGYDKQKYTEYSALIGAFAYNSFRHALEDKKDIYFPFNFGCDRGGADWNIVSKMIDFYFPNAIICKLP